MAEKRSPADDKELLNILAEFFDQVTEEDPGEIDAVLREEGYDPKKLAESFRSFAERALTQSPYNWKNRAMREMQSEQARLASQKPASYSRAELVAAIQQTIAKLSQGSGVPATINFRDFKELTEQDLRSLLQELEYLAPPEDSGTTPPEE